MLSRLVLPLLGAAAIVFACGPHMRSPVQASQHHGKPRPGESAVASRLDVQMNGAKHRADIALHLSNRSDKRVEINFRDGRTHDFALLDATGKTVWRWSTGRMFTQGMQNRLLDPQDSYEITARIDSLPAAGTYTLVAQLRSDNYPIDDRTIIMVR